MKEVMHRAFYEYPADSYGLVYWSHADGWIPYPVPSASTRWIGQDTGEGQDNRMNISDFVDVLDDGMPHFDFIMFDACFMMSVEVAYEVRNYTDYYIGSPTENPGPGAPYDKVVPYMFNQLLGQVRKDVVVDGRGDGSHCRRDEQQDRRDEDEPAHLHDGPR